MADDPGAVTAACVCGHDWTEHSLSAGCEVPGCGCSRPGTGPAAPTLPEPLRAALIDRLLWMADLDRKQVIEAVEEALDEGCWEVRYVGPG